ncbi:MAG: hypothetical protein V4447_10495 [Pseudomonadota bacterium]
MTNPKNYAMRAEFEESSLNQGMEKDDLERLPDGNYKIWITSAYWKFWQAACKPITAQLTRSHDGQPMLSLSNGQSIPFKEIGGMADALKDGEDDKRDAARYRWLRDKSDPGICAFYLSVGKAFDGVKFNQDTVDLAIDAQISAKGQS